MSRKNCHAQSYATPAQRWNQYQYKSYSNASFQGFRHCSSPFAVLIDFISMTRIWVQLLFNIRWLIYYLWWSIANRNSHFSFLHHMSEANASYLEWNGKCFIAEWNGAASSSGVFYEAFCGSAAKYEAHLAMHEAALRAMKQSLTASFRHFFCQKNGGWLFYFHPPFWMAFWA